MPGMAGMFMMKKAKLNCEGEITLNLKELSASSSYILGAVVFDSDKKLAYYGHAMINDEAEAPVLVMKKIEHRDVEVTVVFEDGDTEVVETPDQEASEEELPEDEDGEDEDGEDEDGEDDDGEDDDGEDEPVATT